MALCASLTDKAIAAALDEIAAISLSSIIVTEATAERVSRPQEL